MTIRFNDTATARLRIISGRFRNMADFLKSEAEQLATMTRDSFESGQQPTGGAFKPNAPSTVKRKGSAKPLVETGAMRASVLSEVAGNSAIVSFGVPYAGFNVFGTATTPQRNPLPVLAPSGGSFGIPTTGVAGRFWAGLPERLKRFLLERNGRR